MPLYNQVLAEEDLTSGIAEAAECGDGMSEIGFAHFPKDPEGSCSQVPDQLHLTRPVTRPGTRSADARVVRCADLDCYEILSNHRTTLRQRRAQMDQYRQLARQPDTTDVWFSRVPDSEILQKISEKPKGSKR